MTDPDTQALIIVERRLRDPEFCERLRTLLNRSGFVHVPAAELRAYRVQAAVRMIKAGMPLKDVRTALRARYGISRATAYRMAGEALTLIAPPTRPTPPPPNPMARTPAPDHPWRKMFIKT